MQLTSTSFAEGERVPPRCAFACIHAEQHVQLSDNLSPQLSWRGAPAAARSFIITCIDPDAPTRPELVNKDGREIPADLPRTEFTHWLLVDIPASISELPEGACSHGVTAHGKQQPDGPKGSRQGRNDYTGWFAEDADMSGDYLGYDGPCPPWNDARVHHYEFTVYATDLEHCEVDGAYTLEQLRKALAGHVLDQASLTGRYTLNPRLA